MIRQYLDFEITILPQETGHYSVAVSTPGGDAAGVLSLPTDNPDFQALLKRLELLDTDETVLSELGQMLFLALFQGAIKEVYTRSQGILLNDQGLRLRLNISPKATAVLGLPWEFLYDPDQGPLALLDAPIVRYLPESARTPLLQTELPLRVLLTGAQTPPALEVERELQEVQAALSELGEQVQITLEPHLTPRKLQHLLREDFHVWHFVGHGSYSRDGRTGQLALEDDHGDAEMVSATQLGILLNRSTLRLVVLDACQGARLAIDPFRSMAPAIIRADVAAVVAMQFTVPEEATRAFAGEFYRALAAGLPIDTCVTEGRKAVMNSVGLNRADWGTPVIYTRARDARLFDIEQQPVLPKPPERPTTVLDTKELALDALEVEPALVRAPATNLPTPPTALIGREQDVAAVRERLSRPEVRLLTLTGAAGAGKTRLGIEVAAGFQDDFTDGVFFVNLARITTPDQVLTAIAQTLGLKEQPELALISVLRDYLRSRQLLLVLDNFEQVLPAARQVTELLAAAPALQVLITSRAALRVSGEHEYTVQPLALPDLDDLPGLLELSRSPAVALFVERVRSVKPSFGLTNENAAIVAEICHRLDGLPLAIELAAARSRVLPMASLLAQLSNRLDLLTGGARDLVTRQQTLRGAIAWSYELMPEDKRQLFTRVGVFMGGCTVEAVTAICYEPESSQGSRKNNTPIMVLNGLTALVDMSLLQQIENSDDELRFTMLETIREYALELLIERDEFDRLRRRHAEYYLALAEVGEPLFYEPEQEHWITRLEREHDNLLTALGWAAEQNDGLALLRLGQALWMFWHTRGYLAEGRHWLNLALTAKDESVLPDNEAPAMAEERRRLRARVLNGAARLALTQGDVAQAHTLYEEALALFQSIGDRRGSAIVLNGLAGLAGRLDDHVRSEALFEEGLAHFQALGDTLNVARLLSNRALVALFRDDTSSARDFLEESLSLRRSLGDTIGMIWSLANLGEIANREGDGVQAIARYTESLAVSRKLRAREGIAVCLEGMAQALASLGQELRAARLWGAAEALRETFGAARQQAWRAHYEAAITAARVLADAAEFDREWAGGREAALEQIIAEANAVLPTLSPPQIVLEAPAAPTTPELHITASGETRVIQIDQLPMTIGRDRTSDLVIDDARVSRRHAQFMLREDSHWIVDLRSTNGTFVNGTRVQESELHNGDRLSLGGLEMMFRA